MKRTTFVVLCAGILGLTTLSPADAAIRRVPARYNMLSFLGGGGIPHGEYDAIGPIPITDEFGNSVEVDANDLYENAWFLGFHYGTYWNQHFLLTIGFRYTDHNINEEIFVNADEFNARQYDVEFNLDLYPFDITQTVFSPFVGAGLKAGLTSVEPEGFDSESELNLAVSANFGADLKLFTSPDNQSFMTLASVNDFSFLGSDDRPKYLNIGGALRYWFR